MATILEFRPAARGPSEKKAVSAMANAEIVIFPGVRYERDPDVHGAHDGAVDIDDCTHSLRPGAFDN